MVRSQDDVIVIDRCSADEDSSSPPLDVRLYLNGRLTPGTSIVRFMDGKKYRVCSALCTETVFWLLTLHHGLQFIVYFDSEYTILSVRAEHAH